MRRPSVYSTTLLVIRYGTPMRIFVENVSPSASLRLPPRAPWTLPEPSMTWWSVGSATTSNKRCASAGMMRLAETCWLWGRSWCSLIGRDPRRCRHGPTS